MITNKQIQQILNDITQNITNPDKLKSHLQILEDLEKIITQKLKFEKFNMTPLNIERLSKALYNIQLAKSIIVENLNKLTIQTTPSINELPQHIKLLTYIDTYLQENYKITLLEILQDILLNYNIDLKKLIDKKKNTTHLNLINLEQKEIM